MKRFVDYAFSWHFKTWALDYIATHLDLKDQVTEVLLKTETEIYL